MTRTLPEIIDDISNQPHEALRRSITNCTEILQKQVDKRIKIEADHLMREERIRSQAADARQLVELRIEEFTRQLTSERELLDRINQQERTDLSQEKRRYETHEGAQRKMINAAEVMLAALKAPD